jgi:AraC-like DNA-binding protein
MILQRCVPGAPVNQFVEFLWFYEDWQGSHSMERVLPDGAFELVIELAGGPRKLFDRDNLTRFTSFRRGWISGAHSRYLVIDALAGASMIGAHFKPGGIIAFVPSAAEFRDEVVAMDLVWGSAAIELRERLQGAPGPAAKLDILEQFLAALLRRASLDEKRHERIAWATAQFLQQPHQRSIRVVADRLGVSHKHFIEQFRNQVGLTPKLFCRVRRFQQVLQQINSRRPVQWAQLAYDCGYYDQAHFVHDFQAFSGINPSAYMCLSEDYANFVPLPNGR